MSEQMIILTVHNYALLKSRCSDRFKCRRCNGEFKKGEVIVSKTRCHKRAYYHVKCFESLFFE